MSSVRPLPGSMNPNVPMTGVKPDKPSRPRTPSGCSFEMPVSSAAAILADHGFAGPSSDERLRRFVHSLRLKRVKYQQILRSRKTADYAERTPRRIHSLLESLALDRACHPPCSTFVARCPGPARSFPDHQQEW